ncbi:sialidase family protein [Legionella tucsonensis]|uniref:BNR/Asp-box repeat containing protein n=1 Tax=Legionella tucsonensis TaxID=40335 RepID=A0A0W0ZTW5_9GAMM|nr:sialidase family protein [Legionella tucsonensis]KTD72593.1 BNR/Asp-box repeat containing protein [Legionella tucsonensis]
MNDKYHLCAVGFLGVVASMTSFALPFNITPQGTLPTIVHQGGSVNAAYTVTNNTLSMRDNNFIKWFPPNVIQVLEPTDPTVCPLFFNLGPYGSINQSCTLKLKITGEVRRDDPDPHHHLFACFPGGKTCAGPTQANSLNVNVTNVPPPPETQISVAVGGYATLSRGFPLVYTSSNNGATWPTPVLPPPVGFSGNQVTLIGVACNGNLCTAVGFALTEQETIVPFSYSSSNRGASWSVPNFFLRTGPLATSNDIRIVTVSCVGSNCVSGGTWEDSVTGNRFPLSYWSSNNGVTWSQPTFLSTTALPPGNQGARLGSISCVGTNCSAVGFYNDVTGRQPVSYYSANNGVTWSEAIRPSTFNFPAGYVGGAKLMSVSCVGTNCSAVGESPNPADQSGSSTLPISYTSANGGLTWSLVRFLSTNALPPGNRGAFLNSVSCAGTRCSAVGYYTRETADGTGQRLPVSYFSADNGVTWSEAVLPPTSGIPAGFQDAELTGVSCKNNICSAVGYYNNSMGNILPLTYQSLNNGMTWTLFLPSISSIPGAVQAATFSVGGSESGLLQT